MPLWCQLSTTQRNCFLHCTRRTSQFMVNSLWPSDTILQDKSWSTLVQVMACCLVASSHYLNQCWLISREVSWHSPEGNFKGNAPDMSLKITTASPRVQWVNQWCSLIIITRVLLGIKIITSRLLHFTQHPSGSGTQMLWILKAFFFLACWFTDFMGSLDLDLDSRLKINKENSTNSH